MSKSHKAMLQITLASAMGIVGIELARRSGNLKMIS